MDFALARSQHLCQELYETRIASMQRFVAMVVMFHHMGKRVQDFFSTISFGLWGYRMDRTHSIMRIATTASPVSGADVRQRMAHLRLLKKVQNSVEVISRAFLTYKKRKEETRVNELVRKATRG
jgi:CRISPR/Cas system-associated endonuclease Cas3-HD